MGRLALSIATCAVLVAPSDSHAAVRPDVQRARSAYVELSSDRQVDRAGLLLATAIVLTRPDWVFVESDGSYAPDTVDAAADVYITVDGTKVSNDSMLDWRESLAPREHSFNAIGALRLGRGRHSIEVTAEPLAASAGSFTVRAGANLSVLVHPSASVSAVALGSASRDFDFRTFGINNNASRLPHTPLLEAKTNRARQVVALGSASDLPGRPDSAGDAMLGSYVDSAYPGNDRTSWSVNDHWVGAELVAPLFVQSRLLLRGQSQFTVPRSDSGVVMFTAKSHVQGDPADQGGRVSFWLELDDRRVGSDRSPDARPAAVRRERAVDLHELSQRGSTRSQAGKARDQPLRTRRRRLSASRHGRGSAADLLRLRTRSTRRTSRPVAARSRRFRADRREAAASVGRAPHTRLPR